MSDHAHDSNGPDGLAALQELVGAIAARSASLADLARRLKPVAQPGGLSTGPRLRQALHVLRSALIGDPDLLAQRDGLVRLLEEAEERHGRNVRRRFLEALVERMKADDVVARRLTDDPPVWRLAPFTLQLDLTTETATLHFARIPVGRPIPLDAALVGEAWRRERDEMLRHSTPPDRFLAALSSAYKAALGRRGRPDGERVELRDLYPEVAFALQPGKFLEDVKKTALFEYGRPAFVSDLMRLVREGRLRHGSLRVDLGVAVADAASSRKRAFWIEDDAGTGMFYASFRLVEAADEIRGAVPPDPGTAPAQES